MIALNTSHKRWVRGSLSDEYEVYGPLVCKAAQYGDSPMFWSSISPPFSDPKSKSKKKTSRSRAYFTIQSAKERALCMTTFFHPTHLKMAM
jgi:hypothetical protein